jgi:rod shape-determining protein MreD
LRGFLYALSVALATLLIQTTFRTFVFVDVSKPDVVSIIVLWSSLRLGFNEGLFFAFSAGLLMDALSGSPIGLFAFLYCVSFLLAAYLNTNADLESHFARFTVSFGLCMLQGAVILMSRALAGPIGLGPLMAGSLLLKALVTGVIAVFVIPLMDRFWMRRTKFTG